MHQEQTPWSLPDISPAFDEASDAPAAAPWFPNGISEGTSYPDQNIYLVRDLKTDPERAYRRFSEEVEQAPNSKFQPIPIRRHDPRSGQLRVWGQVLFCFGLERDRTVTDDFVFRPPAVGDPRVYAVKELNRQIVEEYMLHGGVENPFNECTAMQLVSDNRYVLGCVEVLRDETKLYIITPFCEGGDLWSVLVPFKEQNGAMPEEDARSYFRKILECLYFLHCRGFCHRDLSPENIVLRDGRCLLIDLGMALRVPYSDTGRRLLMKPQGQCGKHQYMSPEVFENRNPFDGFAIDLWAVAVILFEMLTGLHLYSMPHAMDKMYNYYVQCRGFHRTPFELMQSEPLEDWTLLQERELAMRELSAEVKDLLGKMLRHNPEDRLTLSEVLRHRWVRGESMIAND